MEKIKNTIAVSAKFRDFVIHHFSMEKRREVYAKIKLLEKFPKMWQKTRGNFREIIFDEVVVLYEFDEEK
jgi:hypothetical protein